MCDKNRNDDRIKWLFRLQWVDCKHPTPIAIQLHPQCVLGIQSILQFSAERVVTIIAFYIKEGKKISDDLVVS